MASSLIRKLHLFLSSFKGTALMSVRSVNWQWRLEYLSMVESFLHWLVMNKYFRMSTLPHASLTLVETTQSHVGFIVQTFKI